MKCSICQSETEDSRICPICGSELESSDNIKTSYPWVLAYTTNTLLDAEMYKANLESTEIPVQILSQVDTTRQLTIGDLAIVKIYVPSIYLSDALEIINAINTMNFSNDDE